MRNRTPIDLFAMVVIVAAFVFIGLCSGELAPRFDEKLPAQIGQTLARETLGLLPASGKISVITRDTEAFHQPAMDALFKSFGQEIRRTGARIAVTQSLQLDPLRPVEVPPGDFYELIRKATSEDVVVSFLGPPVLSPEQRAKLGKVKPKIVAFCSGNLAEAADLRELFRADLLHVAVVNRHAPPLEGRVANGAKTFDQFYTILKASDVLVQPQGRIVQR
jgi:hypothetical protein